jgi:hypothetical protein
MISNYKVSCRKVLIDFNSSTYYHMCRQFEIDGTYRCPFCNKEMITRNPIDYYEPRIACRGCDYFFRFTYNETMTPFANVIYDGAKLISEPEFPTKSSPPGIRLTYLTKPQYHTRVKHSSHSWKPKQTQFTLAQLLNSINTLNLRVQAEIKNKETRKI